MQLHTFIDHKISQSLDLAFQSNSYISLRKSYIGATQTFETEVLFKVDKVEIKISIFTELKDDEFLRSGVHFNDKCYGIYSNLRDAYTASDNISKLLVQIQLLKTGA